MFPGGLAPTAPFAPSDDWYRLRMADTGAYEDSPAVERYLTLFRRRWPVIGVVTVMVTAVALAVNLARDEVYDASADVLLTRLDIAGQLGGVSDLDLNQPVARQIETQAQLARVPAVAARAVRQAKQPGTSAGSLLKSSSVSPRPNADLLTFAVRHPEPEVAVALANAYATAFAQYRSELDVAAIQKVIDDVESQLVVLLQRNDETQRPVMQALTTSLQQLRIVRALQNSNVTVVRPAAVAGKVANQPLEAGVAGGALGLALGIGLALLLEALDRRVRSEVEIARRLGVPLLGRLPSPGARSRRSPGLVMLQQPESSEAEAFRIARTNIEHAAAAHHRTIMLTAVELEADETPRVTANLALALARNSTHTILIDLDLRRGAVDRLFGVYHQQGLTEVVADELDLDAALVTVWSGDEPARGAVLELLPIGSPPASVGELVASPKLHEVVATLRERAPLVVIHGPPLLGTADALALTAVIDGLIVVAGIGLVRRDVLSDLGEELDAVVETLGVIATGVGRAPAGPMPRGRRRSRPRRLANGRGASKNGTRAGAAAQTLTRR